MKKFDAAVISRLTNEELAAFHLAMSRDGKIEQENPGFETYMAVGLIAANGYSTTSIHDVLMAANIEVARRIEGRTLSPSWHPKWAETSGIDEYGHWAEIMIVDHTIIRPIRRITQRLRWIKPGTFLMGSPEDEPDRFDWESPHHPVIISRGFWLFDTPCTQALWRAGMGTNNPSQFRGDTSPVENVGWNDCQGFIKRLKERLPGLNLNLPTEAQWEYACRAGTTTRYCFGDDEQHLEDYAWFSKNSGGRTHPVGEKLPNPWGLYDMHGNVWEWVQDHWHENYQGAPVDGSAWVKAKGCVRVLRGGSWANVPQWVRGAARFWPVPHFRATSRGFRLAMTLGYW